MTQPLLVTLPSAEHLSKQYANALGADIAEMSFRRFPDGETYIRYHTSPETRDVVILACLDRPDDQICQLLFTIQTARELAAKSVGLIAPYLPYMRQDKRFHPGESITSKHFAAIVSNGLDWLTTTDPHLHRRTSLSEIYNCQTNITHASPAISEWIRTNVSDPLIIGPDSESEQWAQAIGAQAQAPHLVLSKQRHGDREVSITLPDLSPHLNRTPVIVDDTISTAGTMIEVTKHLQVTSLSHSVCIAVHGIFAGTAYKDLEAAGAERIVTCNTVPHASNGIDITHLVSQGALRFLP